MGRGELMAKVSEVIEWLSKCEPDEEIALTGWWYKSDVENNNDVELTDEQWLTIVNRHEDNTERHIDEVVSEVLEAN
jgi:hypothetical protein